MKALFNISGGRRTRDRAPVLDCTLPAISHSSASGTALRIPRILYQTIDGREVTTRHLRDWLRFREANSDLDFIVMDKQGRDDYMAESWSGTQLLNIYQRATLGVVQADIFRYAIVFDRGGFYCDINKAVFSSLTSYVQRNSLGLISFESNDALVFPDFSQLDTVLEPGKLVLQWCFGFSSRHPLLGRVIDRIETNSAFFSGREFSVPKNAVLQFSSAGMFTQVFREFALEEGLERISQVGIDFDSNGVFRLEGTRIVEKFEGHYSDLRNAKILSAGESLG